MTARETAAASVVQMMRFLFLLGTKRWFRGIAGASLFCVAISLGVTGRMPPSTRV
jgi:hypothetical protein